MDISKNPKGFFSALFDLSFSQFVTTKLIKLLFIIGLIMISFSYLMIVVGGFAQGALTGLFFLLIIGPLVALMQIIILRVWLELVIVLFKIVEHTGIIARQATETASPATQEPPRQAPEGPSSEPSI